MHYHCEIIIPPVKDIEQALYQVMCPFDENREDEEYGRHAFWDYYVAGGRYAGKKELYTYNKEKLELFYKRIQDEKITFSSVTAGKQTVKPKSQIPIVDTIWNEFFPTEDGTNVPCPLFSHSNNQYDGDDLISCDICRVDEIPEKLKCARVIIAGQHWRDKNKLEAKFMICDSEWNGVNLVPIQWDTGVKTALEMYQEKFKKMERKYREKNEPKPNWLCITVDYHS